MTKHRRVTTAAFVAGSFCLISLPGAAADLVATAQEVSQSGQFEIDSFATALEASGLAETLKGAGLYTVFAPTDAAFETLDLGGQKPQGTAKTPEEQLESVDKDRLAAILKQHIVEGKVPLEQLVEQEELETLEGAKLDVVSAKDAPDCEAGGRDRDRGAAVGLKRLQVVFSGSPLSRSTRLIAIVGVFDSFAPAL
jgi:Fasciclin domain